MLGEDPPERGLELRRLEGLAPRSASSASLSSGSAPSFITFLHAFSSVSGSSKRNPISGQTSLEGLRLLLRDRAGGAQALVGLPAQVARDRRRVLVEVHLAHEAAVQPAELLLVEDRARAARRAEMSKRSISSSVLMIVVSSWVPQPSRAR